MPAAAESLSAHLRAVGGPDWHRDGDDFLFDLREKYQGLLVGVNRLRETPSGLSAELTIEKEEKGLGRSLLHWGRIDPASTSMRETLAKKLERANGTPPQWGTLLDRVCFTVAHEYRAGWPTVELQPAQSRDQPSIFHGIAMPKNKPSLWAGDGDAGKTVSAYALMIARVTGITLPGGIKAAEQGPCLMLDAETDQETSEALVYAFVRGLGVDFHGGIHYRRLTGSLADSAAMIAAERSRLGNPFTIVDSYVPAAGAEPESAEAAKSYFNALRLAPIGTSLTLAHVTHLTAGQQSGAARPWGSVFMRNIPRSVYEVRRSDDDDGLIVGFYHRKHNLGKRLPPLGLRFDFSDGGLVRMTTRDLADEPSLLARTNAAYQILHVLASGAKDVDEMHEDTGLKPATLRGTLKRLKRAGKVIRLDEVRAGKSGVWGLPSTQGAAP